MVARKTFAFIGPSLVTGATWSNGAPVVMLSPGGTGADATRVPAPGWGTNGFVRFPHSTPSGAGFSLNGILTGGTSGTKGRIVALPGAGMVILERQSPTASFTIGETVTQDKDGQTAQIGPGLEESEVTFDLGGGNTLTAQTNTQYATELMSPVVNAIYPADATANLFYDREAQLAAQLPVASSAWYAGVPKRVQNLNVAPTATALVIGTFSSGVLAVADVTGTWVNGQGVFPFGGGASLTTVNGSFVAAPLGQLVPYCARPAIGGIASRWNRVPWGSDSNGRVGALGIEPWFVRKAVQQYGNAVAFFKHDSNAYGANGQGGIAYGMVQCSGTFGSTWQLGETVNCGGWSGRLVAFDVANKRLWFTATNRTVLTFPTLMIGASSGASATSSDTLLGYSKGAKSYQVLLADYAQALTQAGGDTFDTRAFVHACWLGEILIPPASTTSTGLIPADVVPAYQQWMADVVADFGGSTSTIFPAFVHKQNAGDALAFGHSILLRLAFNQLAAASGKFRPVSVDEFEMMVSAVGRTSPDTTGLFPEPIALPLWGRKAWDAYFTGVIDSVGTDLATAPVILLTGQSQMVGQTSYTMLLIDDDPQLTKLETPPGMGTHASSTLDPDIKMYNAAAGRWETFSVLTNAVNFGNGGTGNWGPVVSLAQRVKQRFGKCYVICVPHSTSSMSATAPAQAGTWGELTRVTVTTNVTTTQLTAPSRTRYTASSGTPFAAFTLGENMEVGGGALLANQTPADPRNSPRGILTIGGGGSFIELAGNGVTDAVVRSTFFAQGVDLRRVAGQVIRDALTRLVTIENKIPRAIATCTAQGEGDLAVSGAYLAAAQSHIAWCRSVFGHRVGAELPCPHVWAVLTDQTPLGTDQQIANIRSATFALAGDPRVAVIETRDLPQKLEGGNYSPTGQLRTDKGVHWTGQATVVLGYRFDAALDRFPDLIPANPSGPAALLGLTGGGTAEDLITGGDAGSAPPAEDATGGSGTDTGGTGTTAAEAAELEDAIEEAMAEGLDVSGYTVNGRTVQMRSLSELIAAHKYARALRVAATGPRRTRVQF